MRWEQGRAEVEFLIREGHVQRVPPSRQMAETILAQARVHLESARGITQDDPPGAYALMYDAARKALVAVLENEGLRATSRGGHLAAYEVVLAQLDPPQGRVLRPFQRLRRTRNAAEYPSGQNVPITDETVLEELPRAHAILETAASVLDHMSPF